MLSPFRQWSTKQWNSVGERLEFEPNATFCEALSIAIWKKKKKEKEEVGNLNLDSSEYSEKQPSIQSIQQRESNIDERSCGQDINSQT